MQNPLGCGVKVLEASGAAKSPATMSMKVFSSPARTFPEAKQMFVNADALVRREMPLLVSDIILE